MTDTIKPANESGTPQPDNNTFGDKIQKWIPDRKVLASGISGVIAFFVTTALPEVPADAVAMVVGGVMTLVAYFVPASKSDLIRKADDTLKALGEKHDAEVKVVVEPKSE